MKPSTTPPVTELLQAWGRGDLEARDRLVPLVYDELRRRAANYLRRERSDHTLRPTALVNEAYLRLIGQRDVAWKSRGQFFAIAAQMMRRILVDHARARTTAKRGGETRRLSLDDALDAAEERGIDLVALDEALKRLATIDPQQSQIIELRFFAGLSVEETAKAIGRSEATVKRDWAVARAWLHREIDRGSPGS